MKWAMIPLLYALMAGNGLFAQEKSIRFEGTFSASLVIVDGTVESSLFVRAARPVLRDFFTEISVGMDHRRKTASFIYSAALRKDWPHPKWTPFLLAGVGGETVIVGPYLEARPMLLAGVGFLLPIQSTAFLRLDYQFQRIYTSAFNFNRHYFLLGFVIRWMK